jgi:hypothetical protein
VAVHAHYQIENRVFNIVSCVKSFEMQRRNNFIGGIPEYKFFRSLRSATLEEILVAKSPKIVKLCKN